MRNVRRVAQDHGGQNDGKSGKKSGEKQQGVENLVTHRLPKGVRGDHPDVHSRVPLSADALGQENFLQSGPFRNHAFHPDALHHQSFQNDVRVRFHGQQQFQIAAFFGKGTGQILQNGAFFVRYVRQDEARSPFIAIQEILHRARVPDPALGDGGHAVAELFHVRKNVGGEKDRFALLLQHADDVLDPAPAGGIQAAHRLVQDHPRWGS